MSAELGDALGAVLADPARVSEVPREQALELLGRLAAVQAALVARVAAEPTAPTRPEAAPAPDRLLRPREAAARLGVTVRWLYRHADQLPYTRRLSRRVLRFSNAGMAQEMAAKKTLNKGRSYA